MAEDKFGRPAINKKLHRREHVLADDLSCLLGEPKRFGAYLGLAMRYPEEILRRFASETEDDYRRDQTGKMHRGKLFFYKVGQYAKDNTKSKSGFKKKGAGTNTRRDKKPSR